MDFGRKLEQEAQVSSNQVYIALPYICHALVLLYEYSIQRLNGKKGLPLPRGKLAA
jgi:hypothetical protein